MVMTVVTSVAIAILAASAINAAAIVVAASNSLPSAKSKADIICDGKSDQVELLKSLTRAPKITTVFERNPNTLLPVKALGAHSVEWLPGDYYLSSTLTIPDAEGMVINAEGTRFHYLTKTGDAVRVKGMSQCRYRFGTIMTDSKGAALRIRPAKTMPSLMSIVSFTGLIGTGQRGIGLCVDSDEENVCTMKFEGTDIRGFDIGVFVPDARPERPGQPGSGKTDTNWYWFSYIRMCNTCIWEQHDGIDDGVWNVNVDASIPNSVAVRTAGTYGRWFIIMGTYSGTNTRPLILDPGAESNLIEITPPIQTFRAWEDNSGNNTNVVTGSRLPPFAREK